MFPDNHPSILSLVFKHHGKIFGDSVISFVEKKPFTHLNLFFDKIEDEQSFIRNIIPLSFTFDTKSHEQRHPNFFKFSFSNSQQINLNFFRSFPDPFFDIDYLLMTDHKKFISLDRNIQSLELVSKIINKECTMSDDLCKNIFSKDLPIDQLIYYQSYIQQNFLDKNWKVFCPNSKNFLPKILYLRKLRKSK